MSDTISAQGYCNQCKREIDASHGPLPCDDALRRDAWRYRFLRDSDDIGIYRIGLIGPELDQVLDEAIAGRRSWPEFGL
jgi:hypothetical protein